MGGEGGGQMGTAECITVMLNVGSKVSRRTSQNSVRRQDNQGMCVGQ